MQSVNFRTINGLQLEAMLNLNVDVPIHIPTPRHVTVGGLLKLTHGNRVHPTLIAIVTVLHEHKWSTVDGVSQNLIVRKLQEVA